MKIDREKLDKLWNGFEKWWDKYPGIPMSKAQHKQIQSPVEQQLRQKVKRRKKS